MELVKVRGIKKYFKIQDIRKVNVGYCKYCEIGFLKNDEVTKLFCDSGIDDLNEIEPHCVGIFHKKCFDLLEI